LGCPFFAVPVLLERKADAWYTIYVAFAFGQLPAWRKAAVALVGVRRFLLFFLEIVVYLVNTAPNDFGF
jgi:hypothetical protein